MINKNVVLIGTGFDCEVILRGIKDKYPKLHITVTEDGERAEYLVARYSVTYVANSKDAVKNGDIIIVPLAAEATTAFLKKVATELTRAKLLIYTAPAMSSASVQNLLRQNARIVRAFLNSSAQISQSPITICKAGLADDDDAQSAQQILGSLGYVVVVPEALMDYAVALFGTGPAYVLTLVETLENEAVRLGFPREEARTLVIHTVLGIVYLLQMSDRYPGELRDMMTRPAGPTSEGMRALESGGFRSALIQAVNGAIHKLREPAAGEITGTLIGERVQELLRTRIADNWVSGSAAAEAFSLVSSTDEVKLSRFSVVGDYLRFDAVRRNLEKDVYRRIIKGFSKRLRMRENHLVWGPSGSGKTFFAREVGKSLGDAVEYVELNLADVSKDVLVSRLERVAKSTARCLCVIDETDAKSGETWPYDEIFTRLDANRGASERKVFVLLGSCGANLAELEQHIEGRHKGPDLIKRIPPRNRYELPEPTLGDRLVVALNRFRIVGRQHNMQIRGVEKFALYYVLLNRTFADNKQLDELALATVERMSPVDDVVKYDHLFEYGELENQYFWYTHSQEALKLAGEVIIIED